MEFVTQHAFKQLLTNATRGVNTLDVFLTNRPLLWETQTVFPSLVRSDHLAVLVPPRMTIKPVRRTVYFRDVRVHHKIKMDKELQYMDWSDILSSDDPSESVITLNNKLWSTFDKCFPMKKIRMSSRDPPYMSPFVKYILKMRHKLNNIQSQQEKVTLQEKINKLIRGNQIAAVKEENNRHKNGSKLWWSTLNKLTGRGQNTPLSNIISPDEI